MSSQPSASSYWPASTKEAMPQFTEQKAWGLNESIDRKARDERAKYGWQGSAGSVFAVKVLRASVADSVSI